MSLDYNTEIHGAYQQMPALQTPLSDNHNVAASDFSVLPMHPFGAQIILPTDLNILADHVSTLRAALVEHKMLLIRNRRLSPEEQIALTQLFGRELHRAGPKLRYLPDHPEVFRISNQEQHGNKNTGQYWHSDGHYLSHPSAVTVMHIVQATTDGATCVVDSIQAYENLPKHLQSRLSRYSFFNQETKVAHRIVRPHPLTQRLGLYVNLNAVAVDSAFLADPVLPEVLRQYFGMPGQCYKHQWRDGDTMILDNFATAHTGTYADPSSLRIMHRTTVTGPSVWWRK